MKQPLISVIMATYNHADFVKHAIDSVLSQQGVDFEFLIADDGSSDATAAVVASITDNRINFFPNTVNQGACIVTNQLIKQSKGEFIALINSDDAWTTTDKLVYQLTQLQKNPALAACFSDVNFIDRQGMTINKNQLSFGQVFKQNNRSQGQWLRYFFDQGNCICHPSMLIRKSCYEAIGYYNNCLRQLPDLDMWVRLVKKFPILILTNELINFRILPGENASSQTVTNSVRTFNEHYLIAETFFDNVTREQLIAGFEDCLIFKDIPSNEHLAIEKVLLYFQQNPSLERAYKMVGLKYMYQLLNSPVHRHLLTNDYQIDDRWFHQQMGEIDILRSKMSAQLSQKKSLIKKISKRMLSPFL